MTFPLQVTERAEGPEGKRGEEANKVKEEKKKQYQVAAFLASLPQTFSLLLPLSCILISVFSNRKHYPPQGREEEERV